VIANRQLGTPKLQPILKWAGGKRWFVTNHSEHLNIDFDRYIEPFAGSCAVYFHCQPDKAILADANPELINVYNTLRSDWKKVYAKLVEHNRRHSKQYYYHIRASRPRTKHTQAARFIYLNRTCWNGLYRVNRNGQFNVPIGTKSSAILDTDDFESVHHLLQSADIRCADFRETIFEARRGDLLFVDPPYTVRHNLNGFVKYNETLFSWADQVDLCAAVKAAKSRGATLLMTNANHPSIKELYGDEFEIDVVSRYSSISSSNQSRSSFEELIIR